MTARKQQPKPGKKKLPSDDQVLDDSLDKTFPASDPPSILQPHRRPESDGGEAG